jgi:hypothetical protein
MSAMMASVRPGPPPTSLAITLVRVGRESSSLPKDSNVSYTKREVSCSW